jgi:hypothetical protein
VQRDNIRYRALAPISGHLHVRRSELLDGTRFEEVSLGYPGQWNSLKGVIGYLRQIMPAPTVTGSWRFNRFSRRF